MSDDDVLDVDRLYSNNAVKAFIAALAEGIAEYEYENAEHARDGTMISETPLRGLLRKRLRGRATRAALQELGPELLTKKDAYILLLMASSLEYEIALCLRDRAEPENP